MGTSATRRRSLLTVVGAAAGLTSVLTPSVGYAASSEQSHVEGKETAAGPTPVHDKAAQWAYDELNNPAHNREIGGYNCNFYSGVFQTGAPCGNGFYSEAWCADFAKYTWKNAGANVEGLNARTESFKEYGVQHGTWHTNRSGIRPGDVVVYDEPRTADPVDSSHVGVVVYVNGSDIRVVSGNAGPNDEHVYKHNIDAPRGEFQGYVAPVAA
jgi:hypothetical protein